MTRRSFGTFVSAVIAALSAQFAGAQFIQEGPKLVGTSAMGRSNMGWSVALSADGNTAVLGAVSDNAWAGATWVFTRSATAWVQETKLVGSGSVGTNSEQGMAVAVSGDGNVALVGGDFDNDKTGAAWVFIRSGSSWIQRAKLVGSGAVGQAHQGAAVALSGDGNTAIVGGAGDGTTGAAWVFVRSGSTWVQQGGKLIGSGAIGNASQGSSIALSADGSVALVGGAGDNARQGAVWVFARSGGTWTQQAKLVGTGVVGAALLGRSAALSADGNTAVVGGPQDNGGLGAAWVFVRSGATWTQQGGKLVGTGAVGNAEQGTSVAISGDGNIALIGGPRDNTNVGGAWVFTRSGMAWTQLGSKLVGSGAVGSPVQGRSVALAADGFTALIGGYYDNDGAGAGWVFAAPRATIYVPSLAHSAGVPPTFWKTRLEIHNRGTVQARYTLALLKRDQDNSSPQTADFQLDPGKSVVYTDALSSLFGYTGSAALRATVMSGNLVVTANTYNDQPTGTFGQYIPGFEVGNATAENQEVRIVHLSYSTSSSSGYRTNIGVANACGVPITVNVDLYSKAGALLGRRTFELAPYEFKQETNSFSKVTTAAVDSGYAIVKSATPGARYFAYGSVVENRSGDPIYVPAQ